MADEFCLKMPDFHVTFRDLSHAVNLRHGTNGFTSLPKEGVLKIFSPWKIRRLRPGLNQRSWIPKASTLPVDYRSPCLYAVPKDTHIQILFNNGDSSFVFRVSYQYHGNNVTQYSTELLEKQITWQSRMRCLLMNRKFPVRLCDVPNLTAKYPFHTFMFHFFKDSFYRVYEGHLESKERFAIQRYWLIIGKKQNMQVLWHTFTYFST